jgi:hypothetical protein
LSQCRCGERCEEKTGTAGVEETMRHWFLDPFKDFTY